MTSNQRRAVATPATGSHYVVETVWFYIQAYIYRGLAKVLSSFFNDTNMFLLLLLLYRSQLTPVVRAH